MDTDAIARSLAPYATDFDRVIVELQDWHEIFEREHGDQASQMMDDLWEKVRLFAREVH